MISLELAQLIRSIKGLHFIHIFSLIWLLIPCHSILARLTYDYFMRKREKLLFWDSLVLSPNKSLIPLQESPLGVYSYLCILAFIIDISFRLFAYIIFGLNLYCILLRILYTEFTVLIKLSGLDFLVILRSHDTRDWRIALK